jgi:hypothetical protein
MVLGTQTGSGFCALWSGWTQLASLCSVFFLGDTSHNLLACWCPYIVVGCLPMNINYTVLQGFTVLDPGLKYL